MLDLSLPTADLRTVVACAAGAALKHSTMPILASCLIEVVDGTLAVSTTDSFCSERSSVAADVKASGSVCVDARLFSDIVKKLPDGVVKLRLVGTGLELKVGKIRFKVPSVPADGFPALPDVSGAKPLVTLASDVVLRLIAQAGYCMSTDDSRPHLNGLQLELADDQVHAVATDGHRLAVASAPAKHGPASSLLIPAKGIGELKKLCATGDAVEVLLSGTKLLLMRAGATTVTSILEDSSFPPWRKVVPAANPNKLTLDRHLLINAVKRVATVADAKASGLRLEFGQGDLSIYAESADVGEAQESIECACGFSLVTGVSSAYFAQALLALTGDDVLLEMGGTLDPIVIKDPASSDAMGVCMPMRI